MEHARLSPSGASRWAVCPASVKVSEQYENKTNSAAEWGTKVHDLGEKILKGQSIDFKLYDDEQIEVAEDYADYCTGLMTKKSVIMIEERFNLEFIAPNTFGTGDCSILDDNNTLHIVDLKTGRNVVYAKDNMQLKLYALGAIHELESIYNIEKVVLHIVQNRIGHIDTWEVSIDELIEFKQWIIERAKLALSDNAPFNPQEKACQYCPHQANCEALAEHVNAVLIGDFDNLDELDGKADKLTVSHIKNILDNASLIKSFVQAVENIAVEKLEAGETVEGYKLVESRTNRKWSDEEEVERYLKERNDGINYYKAPSLLPMTQILKILKKDSEIEKFIVKPKGTPTLAPLSDKRPSIDASCDSFDSLD